MHWCPQPLEQHFCSLGQSLSVWQNSAHKPAPHFRRGHLPGFAEGKEEHGNMALICLFFSRNYRLVFYGLYVSVWGQIKFSDKSKILNKKKKTPTTLSLCPNSPTCRTAVGFICRSCVEVQVCTQCYNQDTDHGPVSLHIDLLKTQTWNSTLLHTFIAALADSLKAEQCRELTQGPCACRVTCPHQGHRFFRV